MSADRVALITGGSRGIGAATALRLARDGYRICLSYRVDAAAADAVTAAIHELGVEAIAVQADVAREVDVLELFECCERELGRLDALVNNAGVVAPKSRVDQLSAQRLEALFAVNVTGAFLCAREAVRTMSTRHGGSGGGIVNVSSIAARIASPGEYVDYAASKAAVDVLTRGLALEVAGEGIRVNAVRPGIIDTGIHASGGQPDRVERLAGLIPMARGGTAAEVADAVAWLLSDAASYCTGTLLDVAGGR